jgi:hypothetical protein
MSGGGDWRRHIDVTRPIISVRSYMEKCMRLGDLIDPERGQEALVKFALYALILAVVSGLVVDLLSRLSGLDTFLAFLFLISMSPLAYLIREARGHRPQRGGARRGAERTPLLPPNEDEE